MNTYKLVEKLGNNLGVSHVYPLYHNCSHTHYW